MQGCDTVQTVTRTRRAELGMGHHGDMTPTRGMVIAAVLTVFACGESKSRLIPTSTVGFGGPSLRPAFFSTIPAELPHTLVVGHPVRITVVPYGEDAQPDCHVEYLGNGTQVRWDVPSPPCPQNTCADLVGLVPVSNPYYLSVNIMICPPGLSGYCPEGTPHWITVVPE